MWGIRRKTLFLASKVFKASFQQKQMFPAGYANFSYHRSKADLSSPKTAKVACGTGRIEMLLEEELETRGLELSDGNLAIDKEKSEINIYRSLVLPEKGLSVAYNRAYPDQYGFDKMMRLMGCELRKASGYPQQDMIDMSLSDLFKKYLIRNMCFTEKTTFSRNTSPEAWIQGKMKFIPDPDGNISEEHAEYSVGLSDSFIEEIAGACHKNGKSLSAKWRNILANKEEPLEIDTFLRMIDICLARSNDESVKVYRNLRKCGSFIMDTIFKDSI